MDNLDADRRSALMSRVARENTQPELVVRRLLHSLGYRYTLHRRDLPGSPDIVFSKRRKAIFVHGCFWHGHVCRFGRLPKSNAEFWANKIARNRERDARVERELQCLGWSVLTVWQCELRASETLTDALLTYLGPPSLKAGTDVLPSRERQLATKNEHEN